MDLHSILLAVAEATTEAVRSEESVGVFGTFGINWKLFLGQLINFAIVLFIFWKWVVKPLGKTLTDRQEKIEKGLKYSEAMEEEKKKFDEWKTSEMKRTRIEADNIMRTATDSATKIKQEIIGEAQGQANKLLEQTKQALQMEKEQMLKEVRSEAATLVVAASEMILRSKLDPKKDHELINESLKNVRS